MKRWMTHRNLIVALFLIGSFGHNNKWAVAFSLAFLARSGLILDCECRRAEADAARALSGGEE